MCPILKDSIIIIWEFVTHLNGGTFESFIERIILNVLTYLKDFKSGDFTAFTIDNL